MRSFLVVMAALLLVGADAAPTPGSASIRASSGGIDQEVLLVGEDLAVLPVPALPEAAEIVIPTADLRPPTASYPGPAQPAEPAWWPPAPAEVLALVEAIDA